MEAVRTPAWTHLPPLVSRHTNSTILLSRAAQVAEGRADEEGPGGGQQQLSMHPRLTVGVVAMNDRGEVGAASSLGPENVHRGRPGFPVVCWRGGGRGGEEGGTGEVWRTLPGGDALHLIVADESGASF